MHRTDSAGSTADHLFTNGDPAADIDPTEVDAEFLNDVQENLCQFIEAAGIALEKGDYGQLAGAVLAYIAAHNGSGAAHEDIRELIAGISIPTATVDVAGILKLAGTARALLGTDSATAITPADLAAVLAARPIIDMVARDQIALANLRMLINTAVTTGALVQGRMWELLTDEWATGSSGYAFVAGAPGYYTNKLSTTVGNSLTVGAVNGEGVPTTFVELNFALPAGQLTKVTLYSAYARTGLKAQAWRNVSGTTYDFLGESQTFDVVVGLNVITLATPITVQAGDRLGLYSPSQSVCLVAVGSGNVCANNAYQAARTTFSSANYTLAIQGTVITGSGDMVLAQPAAITLAAAPAYADTYCLYKDDSGSAALGTDLVVEMSRDNGGTWTPASSYANETGAGGFDGTYAAIKARCNLSAQPSGTSLRSRIKTLNTKAQRVAAPAVYAE